MNAKSLNQWRGETTQKLDRLVIAVEGTERRKGLVDEVADINLAMARQKGHMALFAGLGSFAATIVTGVIVAALVKFFL